MWRGEGGQEVLGKGVGVMEEEEEEEEEERIGCACLCLSVCLSVYDCVCSYSYKPALICLPSLLLSLPPSLHIPITLPIVMDPRVLCVAC